MQIAFGGPAIVVSGGASVSAAAAAPSGAMKVDSEPLFASAPAFAEATSMLSAVAGFDQFYDRGDLFALS